MIRSLQYIVIQNKVLIHKKEQDDKNKERILDCDYNIYLFKMRLYQRVSYHACSYLLHKLVFVMYVHIMYPNSGHR